MGQVLQTKGRVVHELVLCVFGGPTDQPQMILVYVRCWEFCLSEFQPEDCGLETPYVTQRN